MNWGVNEWVAAISAVLALASLVLNWLVVRRQTALQVESLKAQTDSEVLSWAHEAIDLVTQGAFLARGRGSVYSPDEFKRLALETCQKLSSSADRGRLFFPNEGPTDRHQDKEGAFQGYRPPILDCVVFASTQIDRLEPEGGPDEDAARFMIKCRRLLVSELQNAIDPRRRIQILRQLAIGRMDDKKSSFRIAAELGEALETRYPGVLIDRRDESWIAAREAMLKKR
jgi:hypothetical protein